MRATFPDGVHWISLGAGSEPFDGLDRLARGLGNESVLRIARLQDAAQAVGKMLRDRQLLVLLDDVARSEDTKPFRDAMPMRVQFQKRAEQRNLV